MAFGTTDELQMGDNMRDFLAVAALQELRQIVLESGRKLAREETDAITGERPHTLKIEQAVNH
jgi:glycerol-3-phosphate dehydrogenase (NAD(P)+)